MEENIMLNENLIATLEQSLRQTRNAQSRLLGRLREVETEADSLRQEIEAMENSAEQTEQAIMSLLATMGSGNKSWKNQKSQYEDDYEIPTDIPRPNLRNNNNQRSNSNNYRNNSLSYINNPKGVPSISQNIEPISHRFEDRTITQACYFTFAGGKSSASRK